MELIEKATKIAKEAHKEQVRKTDGSPYINHPLAVADILKEFGFEDTVVAAAIVHDVLEDTPVTEVELRGELGDEIADIVISVSEDKKLEWEARKQQYINQVTTASEAVKAVSVADKIHNAESLLAYYKKHGPSTWNKFNRGRTEKLWFECSLLEALQKDWEHPLLQRYAELVEELKSTS